MYVCVCTCVNTCRCFWSLCTDQKRKSWVLTSIPFCLSLYSLVTENLSDQLEDCLLAQKPKQFFLSSLLPGLGSRAHTDIFSILCGCLVCEFRFSHLHTEHSYLWASFLTLQCFIWYGRLRKEMRTHTHNNSECFQSGSHKVCIIRQKTITAATKEGTEWVGKWGGGG